jgi:hypothetical protein
MKYPSKISAGAERGARRRLSGTISVSAVASIKPAPSAMKSARNVRLQGRAEIMAPPNKLANPATKASARLIQR